MGMFFNSTPKEITDKELRLKVERELVSDPYFRHLPEHREYIVNNLHKLLDVDRYSSGDRASISEKEVQDFIQSIKDPDAHGLEEQRRYNIHNKLSPKQLESLETILKKHL